MLNADIQIEDKYESGKNRLIQEHDKIYLSELIENLKNDSNYLLTNLDAQLKWDKIKQSQLIESLLVNIPVPPLVLWEVSYKSYRVIDGVERIKAIVDFYHKKLTLSGLEIRTELNGCNYANLPSKIRELLNRRSLNLKIITPAWDASRDEVEKLIQIVSQRLGN